MVPETIVTNNHEILGLVKYSAIGPFSVTQATMQRGLLYEEKILCLMWGHTGPLETKRATQKMHKTAKPQ